VAREPLAPGRLFSVWKAMTKEPASDWEKREGIARITHIPERGYVVDSVGVQNAAFKTLEEAKIKAVGGNQWGVPTKFSKYTIPGGQNYRELLLMLPNKTLPSGWQVKKQAHGYIVVDEGGIARSFIEDTPQNAINNLQSQFTPDTQYKSPHWDEPNILAHIRFNERTDSEGSRVLFIEEMQSDFSRSYHKSRASITNAVKNDFHGIIKRMKDAGVLEVNCD